MGWTRAGLTVGRGARVGLGAPAAIGVAAATLALGSPAMAQYLVGVTAGASTDAGGNSVLYSYNYNILDQFPGAGYRYVPGPCASGVNSTCSVSGSGPTTLADTLTAASAAVQASHSGLDFYGNPFDITASSSAAANLATGTLSVAAAGSLYGNANWGVGSSQAVLYDTLTFNIPGAGLGTVTDVTVSLRDTGSMGLATIYGYGSLGNTLRFGGGAYSDAICVGCGIPENLTPTLTSSSISGWVSDSLSADGLDFTGVYGLTGANPSITFEAYFGLNCFNGITCGYDGQVSLGTPAGVSYTSASNVFLTQGSSAPEPATWTMMLAGVGGVGAVLRLARRRAAPTRARA